MPRLPFTVYESKSPFLFLTGAINSHMKCLCTGCVGFACCKNDLIHTCTGPHAHIHMLHVDTKTHAHCTGTDSHAHVPACPVLSCPVVEGFKLIQVPAQWSPALRAIEEYGQYAGFIQSVLGGDGEMTVLKHSPAHCSKSLAGIG